MLSRLLFFLESNSILSPRQASFHPGPSTLDQILYLSQSILDEYNKPKPGSLTILSTIDFLKALDSDWHPALFNKLILAGLPPCFARWTQSFLSDRHTCVVFQNHKSHSFWVNWGVLQKIHSWPITFLSLHQSSSGFFAFFCQLLSLCWWSGHLVFLPLSPYCSGGHTRSSGRSTGVFLSIWANVRPPSSQ